MCQVPLCSAKSHYHNFHCQICCCVLGFCSPPARFISWSLPGFDCYRVFILFSVRNMSVALITMLPCYLCGRRKLLLVFLKVIFKVDDSLDALMTNWKLISKQLIGIEQWWVVWAQLIHTCSVELQLRQLLLQSCCLLLKPFHLACLHQTTDKVYGDRYWNLTYWWIMKPSVCYTHFI